MVAWRSADGARGSPDAASGRGDSSGCRTYCSVSGSICLSSRGPCASGGAVGGSRGPLSTPRSSGGGSSAQPRRRVSACLEAAVDDPSGLAPPLLEDVRGKAGGFVGACRTQRGVASHGLIYARHLVPPYHGVVLRHRLVVCERLRPALIMDYAIALLIAIGLGVYLFYALLRPEKF